MTNHQIRLPKKGRSRGEILAQMQSLRRGDVHWEEGKVFSLVYFAGEEAHQLLKEAHNLFFSENMLNPTAFPSLRRFETEVVKMTAHLLGGDENVVGNMTSGGTESILMAVKTARDWARVHRPEAHPPEIILPVSGHPAFEKAAHYFGLKVIHTPLRPDFKADTAALRESLTPNTILLVGSAPSYPHGVVDPIEELASIAVEHDLLLHVDACVGGFMLPFVRSLGYPVPEFDFRLPGVSSISADLHKYGYAAKGASVVLYRERTLRRHQFFATTDWPGGIYASPTMSGTRPAGPIAAAWAIMHYLGEEGYLRIAEKVMQTTLAIREGVEAIPSLKILGDPAMSVLAIASDELDVYEVADEMGLRGWHLDRQQFPPSLHLTINYAHVQKADVFLRDLADSVQAVRQPGVRKSLTRLALSTAEAVSRIMPERLLSKLTARATSLLGVKGASLPKRSAPIYGMMARLPNRGDLKEVVLDLLEQFTE